MAAELPLVGRRAELAVMVSALTPGVEPRVVVLVGEAGVGKTRLVSEAVRRCGTTVLTGRCLPLAESVPFLPVTEVLHELSPHGPPPALDRCAGHVHAELARLMPDWGEAEADRAAPPSGWARGRLFAALRDLFAAVAAEEPHALVIDDLHWADASTLDFLAYHCAADRAGATPMVLTCREEIDPAHPAGSWLAEFERRPEVTRIRLDRLSRAEVAEHVGGLLGRPATPSYLAELYARAAGNAFFTEQLVAAGGGEAGAVLPAELARLLVARADAAGADGRAVLGFLGLAGRPVDEGLLAGVTGLAEPDLITAIRRLVEARLIEPSTTDGRYRLRHALVGEAVSGALTISERQHGHARLARLLGEGTPADRAGEVAGHLAAAGRVADEAPWRVTAAREAERVLAHREAANHWLRLIELQPDLAAGPDLADIYLNAQRAGLLRQDAAEH
jgi:predicted ATPase